MAETKEIDHGGPAFPCEGGDLSGLYADPGMSVRDYAAIHIMASMAQSAGFQGAPWKKLAVDAIEAADAYIAARKAGA